MLDAASKKILLGVHLDLQRVVERAVILSPIKFRVVEGLRTLARQKHLKATGMSKTLNSRHLTGHAIDIVPAVDLNGDGKITGDEMWHHSQLMKLSPYIKQAFKDCGVAYEWGGDWPNAWDKPHWQLPWKKYPIQNASYGGDELDEAFAENPMETPVLTSDRSRLLGEMGGASGGLALLADATVKLQEAESFFNAGTIFSAVIGTLILVTAAAAFYIRWTEKRAAS